MSSVANEVAEIDTTWWTLSLLTLIQMDSRFLTEDAGDPMDLRNEAIGFVLFFR